MCVCVCVAGCTYVNLCVFVLVGTCGYVCLCVYKASKRRSIRLHLGHADHTARDFQRLQPDGGRLLLRQQGLRLRLPETRAVLRASVVGAAEAQRCRHPVQAGEKVSLLSAGLCSVSNC